MMKTKYVIYGYEWSTDEKGAAPEINYYRVAQVNYTEHDDLKMAIHSDFTRWKNHAKVEVWREVYRGTNLNTMTPYGLSILLEDFDQHSTAHWYFLTEEEFQEWVAWAEEGHDEVEVCSIQFNG